jgi:hypothetical protein
MLNATIYDYTESFYCIHLYIIVQCILLLEEPNDKAQVKGAHSYKVMSLTQLTYSSNPVTGPEGHYVFLAKLFCS